jgi:hypothetical protein
MKSIIAAGILLASGSAASAIPLFSLPFDVSTARSAAFNVRSCPVEGDSSRGVCYNQEKTLNLGLYSFERERSYAVDCARRVFSQDTVHGQVGRTFCPIQSALAPAPFLQ